MQNNSGVSRVVVETGLGCGMTRTLNEMVSEAGASVRTSRTPEGESARPPRADVLRTRYLRLPRYVKAAMAPVVSGNGRPVAVAPPVPADPPEALAPPVAAPPEPAVPPVPEPPPAPAAPALPPVPIVPPAPPFPPLFAVPPLEGAAPVPLVVPPV